MGSYLRKWRLARILINWCRMQEPQNLPGRVTAGSSESWPVTIWFLELLTIHCSHCSPVIIDLQWCPPTCNWWWWPFDHHTATSKIVKSNFLMFSNWPCDLLFRSSSPLLSLTNSLFGAPITSVTGSSIDFEQLNTRFTLIRHQLDIDVTWSDSYNISMLQGDVITHWCDDAIRHWCDDVITHWCDWICDEVPVAESSSRLNLWSCQSPNVSI